MVEISIEDINKLTLEHVMEGQIKAFSDYMEWYGSLSEDQK